jgi:flagellar biosynthesis/type III secretory pathway chaperone
LRPFESVFANFEERPIVTTTLTASPAADVSLSWESQVSDLLAELSDVQAELLQVLQEKRDRLAAVDLAGLAALAPREEAVVQRLDACQRRRRELLAAAAAEGRPAGSLGVLVGTSNEAARGKLGASVKSASARMRVLQHHSLANWVLAQRRLLHVAQSLEIIATGGRMRPTYGDTELYITNEPLDR